MDADQEIGNFDDIQEVAYVKFDNGVVTVRFHSSEFLVGKNTFGNKSYSFAVVEGKEDKYMSVTSVRLMLRLKELHPLEGKVVKIERVGTGMDTDYNVTEIK